MGAPIGNQNAAKGRDIKYEEGLGLGVNKRKEDFNRPSSRMEDYPGINPQEKFDAMQNALEKYNIDRAESLMMMLSKDGIKTTGSGILGQDKPYTLSTNSGGLKSVYMEVPGYGTVRFSDHVGSSKLSGDLTFDKPSEAYKAIKEKMALTSKMNNDVKSLRNEIGISNDSNANKEAIKNYISKNPQTGEKKDIGAWKRLLKLSPISGDWTPLDLK